MALYELVREIENSCERNQMRDVFFDEVETDDPERFVREMLRDEAGLELVREEQADGSFTIYARSAGMSQRFLFTPI